MTTNLIGRIATGLTVSAMLATGQPVLAEEAHAAAPRHGLTLGGQPLARLLSDPMLPDAVVQASLAGLDAHADGMGPQSPRANALTKGSARPKRRARAGWVGAGIGAGLGVLAGAAANSYCYNEGGAHCWGAFPVLGGLAALAGYGIGKCMSLVAGKISAIGRPRPHRVNGRTALGGRDSRR